MNVEVINLERASSAFNDLRVVLYFGCAIQILRSQVVYFSQVFNYSKADQLLLQKQVGKSIYLQMTQKQTICLLRRVHRLPTQTNVDD